MAAAATAVVDGALVLEGVPKLKPVVLAGVLPPKLKPVLPVPAVLLPKLNAAGAADDAAVAGAALPKVNPLVVPADDVGAGAALPKLNPLEEIPPALPLVDPVLVAVALAGASGFGVSHARHLLAVFGFEAKHVPHFHLSALDNILLDQD